ncbi:MAG: glycosyltransferase family 2 protein [Pseudomonadota bacterium]
MTASGGTTIPVQRRDDGPFRLSVIVPMFNEEGSADAFFDAVLPVAAGLTPDFEILCVDDGSRDDTAARVRARIAREPRIGLIRFSRNFGKEAALTAALDHCEGDAVVSIDADLQMRPEVIADMVAKWREGWDVVAATRADRATDSGLRAFFSRRFYHTFNRIADTPIPPETGDFRLLDRGVVLALRQLPERTRFMKGLFAWVGFTTTTIEYDHGERHAGTSSFKLWKLWNFALDGITSFSTFPLRVWSYVGFATALLAFVYGSWIVLRTLIFGSDVPGYASLLVFILFLGGIQLISLGVLGEYVGRLLIETKRRPIYLARSAELPARAGHGPAVERAAGPADGAELKEDGS